MSYRLLLGLFLILGAIAVSAFPATAQLNAKHAKWTAALVPADARAGEGAQVVVTGTIDKDWHIYAPSSPKNGPIATTVELTRYAVVTQA